MYTCMLTFVHVSIKRFNQSINQSITHARHSQAPPTCAFESITDPARGTGALEASGRVGAGGVVVAVMGSDLALVDV